jgi:hypothetical protein
MPQERNRGLVLLFLLLSLLTLAGVAQAIYLEQMLATDRAAALSADRDAETALVAVADYRAAEAGYLAAGQEASVWMTRVDGLASTIHDAIDRRSAAAASADVKSAYASASAILEDLGKLDTRARALVKNDERILASDVIFMDCLQEAGRLSQAVTTAREADRTTRDATATLLGQIRLGGIGLSALAALVLGGVLMSRARRPAAAAAFEDAPAQSSSATTLSLGPIKTAAPPPPPVQTPVAAMVASDVRLSDAADLCVDLARLLDGRDIPALFERAADVLDAKGLVLWVADAGGASLRPSLTHGYSERVLARMQALPLDGDNATSLAYRSLRAQVVGSSSATGAGALAVPLVTASGCVGVLSAEVKNQKPGADTLSVAQMIAAQFSALVAPADSSARAAQA